MAFTLWCQLYSYLIDDEKVCLIDTVEVDFFTQYIEHIQEVIGDRKVDYLVINHMEPDHSGSIALIKNRITRKDLENGLAEEQWDALISTAKQFSAEVCQTLYNYVSPAFGALRQQELKEALEQESEQ